MSTNGQVRGARRESDELPALTPEVLARLDTALRARPVEDLPSGYGRPIYDLLLAHGFDRGDLLALAASLVDLVANDVSVNRAGRT